MFSAIFQLTARLFEDDLDIKSVVSSVYIRGEQRVPSSCAKQSKALLKSNMIPATISPSSKALMINSASLTKDDVDLPLTKPRWSSVRILWS
ncbi:hypothetical protein J6590_028136 [Homalodisca vitripennis]|nr:hypothetical protein J6590_028136 [Homalodisca vitripennis]